MGLDILDRHIKAERQRGSTPAEGVKTITLWVQPQRSKKLGQNTPRLRLRDDDQLTLVHMRKHRTMVGYRVKLVDLQYCLQWA